jgi:type VI secretion system secreted protein VgrG
MTLNISSALAELAELCGANRPILLRMWTVGGARDDLLMVKRVSGIETICGGIEYRLQCVSAIAGMPLKQFIAMPVELQFVTDTGGMRAVCGIVDEAVGGEADGGLASYQLVVRDALAVMDKGSNSRIFRNKNEVDITAIILDEWRHSNPVLARAFDFKTWCVKTSYPRREFTMQYNESDAAFLRRLWKRRGLAWFIQPGPASTGAADAAPTHTLVLFDNAMTLEQNAAGIVRYHRDDGTEKRDCITAWHSAHSLRVGSVTRQSWNYKEARMARARVPGVNGQGELGGQLGAALDDGLIDVPHAGDDADDYDSLARLRMEHHEFAAKCFHGEGGVRDLCVGQWIALTGQAAIDAHPPEQRRFVITELRVAAENNLPKALNERAERLFALNRWSAGPAADVAMAALGSASAERGARYSNQFICVRRGVPIVPAYDPRRDLPRTGSQDVIVVGPPGEAVHCDALGRVKVRFPGCSPDKGAGSRADGLAEHDSAWVRVATSWAGAQFGAISLPRVGTMCRVSFLGNDPDKPIITSAVHGGTTPPPSFSHVSRLPGDRYLSGIVSREIGGARSNQLRLDDTPGQISAQLASDHANSQLNLGYLTHPRAGGNAAPRGEGAELRSDDAVAIRGGKGVYVSADACLRAGGAQLERTGLAGLAEIMNTVQQQMTELAGTHGVDPADKQPLAQLVQHVTQWENGTNVEAEVEGEAKTGGQPIVAVDAPAGMLLASGANIALGAQSHVDIVSVGNTQLSAGRKLLLRATESISLFAHKLGMKLVAASGKLELQTHQDNIELTSARRIVLTASEEIVLQAPKVTIISNGAQAAYGGGAITYQCIGAYAVKAADFGYTGPGAGDPGILKLPKSAAPHDQRVRITDLNTGEPLSGQRYRVEMEDGQVIEGTTDTEGMTQMLKSSIAFGRYTLHALDN